MRITHLGHSCLLIEDDGARLLIDPGGFTHGFEELTDLDAVLVTHVHPDHLDVERLPVLLEANDRAQLVVEPQTAAELQRAGIPATALHVGQTAQIAGFEIGGVGGWHALIHDDVPRVGNLGLVLRSATSTLFHPGDMLDTVPEDVDVLAVPLAAPWAALKEMAEFVRAVAPRVAFPIHDAVLSPAGRAVYLRVLGTLAPEKTSLVDLAGTPGSF